MASISKAEKSYIQTSLQANLRHDGRSLLDFRTVLLETGVAPLANGSAKLNIGKAPQEGGGGTEILAAAKLEAENVETGDGVDGGRLVCTVTCSPSAYPHFPSNALDELQYDLTTILHQTLSHPTLHPQNLTIIQGKKSWLLNLDVVVLADAGNVRDAIFMAARAALWDTKVPRTRPIQYQARKTMAESASIMDVDVELTGSKSGFNTREVARAAADFELPDYWDEGEALDGGDKWPVAVTLNLLLPTPLHYLDATLAEEAAIPFSILLGFSFPANSPSTLQAMRLLGPGELVPSQMKTLVEEGEKYARELFMALETKLREEDVRRNVKARGRFSDR